MKVSRAKALFYDCKEAARYFYHGAGRLRHQRLLRRRKAGGGRDVPRLNFGRVEIPRESGTIVIGGAVKLIALRQRFPEHLEGFNIIYLVSSAIPPFAVEFVQWAQRRGCRLVWNQNGVAYPAWCGDYSEWFNRPMKALYDMADYIVFQSDFCRESAQRFLGPSGARFRKLFNPVDLVRFSPPENPVPAARWQLLAAGTVHHAYRVEASLQCLRHLLDRGREAHLAIAGEMRWTGGDTEVSHMITKFDLAGRVTRLPAFTQQGAPEIYRRAHVLLHPKYKDPCPTVPIEAMACGLPVVGSHSGGMPELVPNDCGRLIEVPDDWQKDHAPDPAAMADAVEELMAGWATYSSCARRHAEQSFGKDAWLAAHEDIFQGVLQ